MNEIVRHVPSAAVKKATALVYYSGSANAARAVAPSGGVRFCNAKYWKGEIEDRGVVSRPGEADVALRFANVYIAPGCQHVEGIAGAYAAVGVEVEMLEPPKADAPAAPPPAAKTPQDLGWKLRSTPAAYLKRSPKGAASKLARKIIKELGA